MSICREEGGRKQRTLTLVQPHLRRRSYLLAVRPLNLTSRISKGRCRTLLRREEIVLLPRRLGTLDYCQCRYYCAAYNIELMSCVRFATEL